MPRDATIDVPVTPALAAAARRGVAVTITEGPLCPADPAELARARREVLALLDRLGGGAPPGLTET